MKRQCLSSKSRRLGRASLLLAAVSLSSGGFARGTHVIPEGIAKKRDTTLATRSVAITFDDLPFAHADDPNPALREQARKTDATIRRALARHAVPATGFVNEAKVRSIGVAGTDILQAWTVGDLNLGNHGFSHADSNTLTLDQIEQEIVTGEATIRPMAQKAGRQLQFFRFPYNHVGETEARRLAIEQMLAARGYKLAASTIDTSDYLFDQAYERAIAAHDRAMQKRIKAAYIDYSRIEITYYASLNRQALGYEPPEVMLLHANRLNAAVAEPLLSLFSGLGYRFVSLARAQSDPTYDRPPAFATKFGPMWGYRWARERKVMVNGRLEKDPPEWLMTYAAGK